MVKHIQIAGSKRIVIPNARKIEQTNPKSILSITVIVRRKGHEKENLADWNNHRVSKQKDSLEIKVENNFIHEDDLKAIQDFAYEYDLVINEVKTSAGIVTLTGTVRNIMEAFQVELSDYEHPDFYYRGREGYVNIPEQLSEIVQAVLGLDNRPQAHPHFRLLKENEKSLRAEMRKSSFTPVEVGKLYHFPDNIDCRDQCIGIIELGGGYRLNDISQYFSEMGMQTPKIIDVEVDGAKNAPSGDPNSADGEVALDIEIAAAVAPGAKIAVYFAPNSDAGFLNAITTAIHDEVNKPTVISISWGAPESQWTKQAMNAMNKAFKDAAARGITICCASGDNGSSDGINDGSVHVDFPASSPYVLACGGTRLEVVDGNISNEIVWNESDNGATGGGVSSIFPLPEWQKNIQIPVVSEKTQIRGRGVPDVAGNADPLTGYQILVDGQHYTFGGTSAVAPLYAGLIANINQQLGQSIGFVNSIFYQISPAESGFRDIITGNNDTVGNGSYEAVIGWDACTGLGSIDGIKLLNTLKSKFSSNINV